MKQDNSIIAAIIVLFAAFLGETYILSKDYGLIPFILCGIVLLAAVFFLAVTIQKQISLYLKHKESGEKELNDNVYRLLESRLYNIERYQKAIYNETKSVRINTEELALHKELPDSPTAQAPAKEDFEALGNELKKTMERIAKAIIKHNHENNEQLMTHAEEWNGKALADYHNDLQKLDASTVETLEKLMKVCESGFQSLSSAAIHTGMPQMETVSMEEVSEEPVSLEEEEPDTSLHAILGEAVLEEDADTGDVSAEPVIDEEAPIEDMAAEEPLAETRPEEDTSMEDLPDIDALMAEIAEEELPVATALETEDLDVDIPNMDSLDTDIPSIPEMEDTSSQELTVDEDVNRQLTPEEIAAMFAGSDSIPKASETAPEEAVPDVSAMIAKEEAVAEDAAITPPSDEDVNRQLTPEEIAAMFASM